MIQNVGPRFSQWDTGRSVSISDSNATHMHFANQGDSKAVIIEITEGTAKIPDYLFQTGKTLLAYAVLDGVTLECKSFAVRKRERPENYIYEEDQRNFIYEMIANAENAIAEASIAAENANKATANAINATASAATASENANRSANDANLAADNANKAADKAAHTAKSLMVVGEAKGTNIALDDAIEQSLVGLRVFGKTTQNGTPTPDAPVELVSVGDSGVTNTTVCGVNLVPGLIEGKTYTRNGMTLKVYADRCVCSGTPTAAYAQVYIVHLTDTLPKGVYRVAGGQNDVGKVYLQVLVKRGGKTTYYIQDKTFQIYGDEEEVTVTIQAGASTSAITNYVFYPILHVGSTPIAYEPYKGQTLTVSTPNGLPGIPVTTGGNYTDANGQQWICDEIDFARGVHIQRIGKWLINGDIAPTTFVPGNNGGTVLGYLYTDVMNGISTNRMPKMCDKLRSPTTTYISSYKDCEAGFWSFNTTGGTTPDIFLIFNLGEFSTKDEAVSYLQTNPLTFIGILETPIETPLLEEELAAYADLHTYRDNTTVFNDAGAYMELEYVMDAKKYIDSLVKAPPARISSVTLPASAWVGNASPYSQVVEIDGVTENSQVDLTPSVAQLAVFHHKDIAFVTENEDGVVTVYAIGDKPTNDYSIQVTITEVYV